MPKGWELQDFGPCIAEWLEYDAPPFEWRKPVNQWVARLNLRPASASVYEPALSDNHWIGHYCEIPGAGDALHKVVCFYRVSRHGRRVVRCMSIETVLRSVDN